MNQLKKLNTTILALTLSCGSDELDHQDKPWEVNEDYTIQYKHGIYKTSLEIIEDTCTPSIKDIVNSVELWPPPYAPAPHAFTGAGWFSVVPFNIRAASEDGLLALSTKHDKVRTNDTYSLQLPQPQIGIYYYDNALAYYCLDLDHRDYITKKTLRSINEREFEVEFEDEWIGFTSCNYNLARNIHPWIPKEPCRERYIIKHTIDEEIPKNCIMQHPGSSLYDRPVDPQNTAPYPQASYYPAFTKEDIIVTCTDY